MTTPPATMPQPAPSSAPETAAPTQTARRSRFGPFFGIIATVLTLGAVALAVFAPALTSAPQLQVPQGWQQIYNDTPTNASGAWPDSSGCTFVSQGLDVQSDSTCPFTPASGASLDGGVLVVAKLAPAADVSLSQDAAIALGNSLIVLVSQDGSYQICRDNCDIFSGADNILSTGSTVAWHADAFVSNEVAVMYDAGIATLRLYINGQYVDHVVATLGITPAVALATSSNGEALFTHVAIYAKSAG